VNIAVPFTVPEGCVGRVEESIRLKVQGVLVLRRAVKRAVGMSGGGPWAGCCSRDASMSFDTDSAFEVFAPWKASFIVDGSIGSGSMACEADGSGIKNALTDCNVPLGGFKAEFVVVSQASLCLTNVF